ncbi:MAG: vWA domain-containing protein [Patescibacteria group bacterium]
MEETSNWASRRKKFYLLGIVLCLTAFCFFIFAQFWYTKPSCSDGVRNGEERGVDCGGSCLRICSSDAREPIMRWDPRLFEVLPGLWSMVVYVENPNVNIDAVYVPYKILISGENNTVLYERDGATVLPKNKTVGVFEGSITFANNSKPKRVLFDIEKDKIVWKKSSDTEKLVSITHSPLLRLESTPRVEAQVENKSIQDIKNIELVAVIFDGKDNAIATSRTFIDRLKKGEKALIFFTWPQPFKLGERACTRKSNVVLLLDRSGSMSSISQNPPEPLNSAKSAAVSFVERLKIGDGVGVISFATEASKPYDSTITQDFDLAKKVIAAIEITSGSTQYTNIYSALHEAWNAVTSDDREEGISNVAVLLTDGVATFPRNPDAKSEADDIAYAEALAEKEALLLKQENIEIYTIGLGSNIKQDFLARIASKGENFFFAPTAKDLESIYDKISVSICKEVPARIEITHKILDVQSE